MLPPSHTCSVLPVINKRAYFCLIKFTPLFEISAVIHLALLKVESDTNYFKY